MKRKPALPILFLTLGIFFISFIGDKDDPRSNYAETITSADLKKHLSIIASDDYQGRETAKRGQKKAAEYISQQFKLLGIPELHTGGYLQDVPLDLLFPGEATVSVSETNSFSFGKDFYYLPGGDNQKLKTAEVVFAGYGIQDSLYRDYDGVSANGKTVIVLAGEPLNKKGNYLISGNKKTSSWTEQRRRKSNEAKKQGAAALFIVLDDFKKNFESNKNFISAPTMRLHKEPDPNAASEKPEMPVLFISREMAEELFKAGKQRGAINKTIAAITKKGKPKSRSFRLPLDISILRKSELIHTENVLGYLEGGDLKDELIVITAHYDHLGVDSKDSSIVYNGADDDGSGTVAVIEIAEAFVKAKKEGGGPRRSILFMCFTGEEKGLLGSRWYTDHPIFPLASTVCNLNIDMIGRVDPAHKNDTNYVYVIGSERLSTELKTINESNNAKYTGMLLDYKYDAPNEPNNFYGRSDHYNFAKHNIPIAFFFNGTHADYHKESDEVSKINFPLMERRAKLIFYDAWEIANRDKRLIVDGKTTK